VIAVLNELLPSISWSLIGFLIGWLVGREMLFVHRTKEHAMKEEDDTTHGGPGGQGGPGGVGGVSSSGSGGVGGVGGSGGTGGSGSAPTRPGSRWLGIIISIMAVITVLQGSYYTYETKKTSNCQAKFNSDFALVVAKRAQWANEDKAAEIKLFKDFLSVTKPGQGGKLLTDYLAATDRTDKLRAANPLPILEDRNC